MSNVKYYHIVFEQPATKKSEILSNNFEVFSMAVAYAKIVLQEPNRIRNCVFYSVDYDDTITLIGKMGRDLNYNMTLD
jgi:hypothetical protein